MKIENTSDLACFIEGCTLLGTGGGGNPDEGFRILKSVLEEKGPIEWVDVSIIPDDALAICTFLMGSTAPLSEEKLKQKRELGMSELRHPMNLHNAVCEWEEYTGKKVDIIVPLEVGGSNMPVPMAVAVRSGKTIVDGDYAGRALPEISQATLILEDVPFCPAASVDKYGNVVLIKETINLDVSERMGKFLSMVAFGSTGLAGFPVRGNRLKRLLVPGSVSRALRLGRILKSVHDHDTSLRDQMQKMGGRFLFRGRTSKITASDEEGYYTGFYHLEGEEDFKGDTLKIFFKNENHIAWKNGKYLVSSPDLICCINPETIRPMRNEQIQTGAPLEVYAFPCHELLRRKKIVRNLSPTHFGFEETYMPL